MNLPSLSVIVLTYNHEEFIAECIESILSQEVTFEFEIIICDDASTDGTAKLVHEMASKSPKIRPFYHAENKQPAENFTFAVQQSRGNILALCEGDDFWHAKDKLQLHWNVFDADPSISLTYANYRKVDENGEVLSEACLQDQHENFNLRDLIHKQGPSTHSMVFLRSVLPERFPKDFYRVLNPDTFIMAWAIKHGKSKYIDRVQASYRVHSGGIWSQKTELEKRLIRYSTLLKVYRNLPENTRQEEEILMPLLFHLLTKVRFKNRQLYSQILADIPRALRWTYRLKTSYYRLKNG